MLLENYNIKDIENMTEADAFIHAEDAATIKGHDIYFVDFGKYFGFSCLVFFEGKHIYYANDYQLHHRNITYTESGECIQTEKSRDELKDLYIKELNNKLFTDPELSEPLKDYNEYRRKSDYLTNYYGMRFDYISMFFIGSDKERAARQRKIKKMHFSPVTFAFYYDKAIPEKISALHQALEEQKRNTINNYEYQKNAFKSEMFNHEYSINWTADFDTLSAFGNIEYKESATLTDYFNQLDFNQVQRDAYRAARNEYYKECTY